jgi:hypothetical protein
LDSLAVTPHWSSPQTPAWSKAQATTFLTAGGNAVEGKIGPGKRRYGLDLIREKLATTQGSAIALNLLVMNLDRPLALFVPL